MANNGRLDEGPTHQQAGGRHGAGPSVPCGKITAAFWFQINTFLQACKWHEYPSRKLKLKLENICLGLNRRNSLTGTMRKYILELQTLLF